MVIGAPDTIRTRGLHLRMVTPIQLRQVHLYRLRRVYEDFSEGSEEKRLTLKSLFSQLVFNFSLYAKRLDTCLRKATRLTLALS